MILFDSFTTGRFQVRAWIWITYLTVLAVTPVLSQTVLVEEEKPPSNIRLRAGVLHAPPFAIVGEYYDGEPRYEGFQIDLLDRLSQFALEDDNVTLSFDLYKSPPQYGDALDLIAKDCNTTANPHPLEECQQFDMIVGDYYCNPQRSLRIDFTPAWIRTTMSTVKVLPESSSVVANSKYTTLDQANKAGATVCLLEGTYLMSVVKGKFPQAQYLECASADECTAALKAGECVLYADDELVLRYRASTDSVLEVTREQFNTQYMVWPMRRDLSEIVRTYMKKWMYSAVANATLDELYFKYFQKELCPAGTAGEECELPCDPVHGKANSQGVCVCESTKWTGENCSIEVPENTNMIPLPLKVLAYVMLGVNLFAILVCGIWLFLQRHSPQVRVSQPFFLGLVLLGCGISSFTIVAMAQEDEGEGPVHACMAIPWLYSVGFSVTFGTLFAKIRRVHNMFKVNALADSRGRQGSSSNFGMSSYSQRRQSATANFLETVCVILLVLIVDILILIWWTIVSPLEWERHVTATDQFGTPLESRGYCISDHWVLFFSIMASYHLVLLSAGCYLCYVVRKIPTQFHEGKAVSIAMISNLQIFLVGVPILVVLGSAPQSSFFVRSVIIWMNDFVVLALIFGNLMYSVHFEIESAEPAAVKAAIGQAMEQYANTTQRNSGGKQVSSSNSGPKASQLSATSPAPMPESSSSSNSSHSRELNGEASEEHLVVQPSKEITLTRSDLDIHSAPLRRGETYRMLQESRPPSQSTPLPRSMMASSVSTYVCENLTPSDDVSNRSSHGMSNVSGVSMESTGSTPGDAVGQEIQFDAILARANERQSRAQRRRSLNSVDDEQGCHTIVEGRTIDDMSVSNSKLPPVELPDDSPAHLSYAASRILHVRDCQEKDLKKREDKTFIGKGQEGFNDETDTDASTINSERATKQGSSRKKKDNSGRKNAASQRRRRRKSPEEKESLPSSLKPIKMGKSDPGSQARRSRGVEWPGSIDV